MKITQTAPSGWDDRIAFPLQSAGYAEAATALGHRPLFVDDEHGVALVLLRRVPVPLLGTWTARAKVYAHAHHASFLRALVETLRSFRVSHVKIGDAMWGVRGELPRDWGALGQVVYHVFTNDLRLGDEALLARAKPSLQREISKAMTAVNVSEVRTSVELRDYLRLSEETGQRMRSLNIAAVYPASYFEVILKNMVPRRQAAVFIARAGNTPVAGAVFLVGGDRFAYLHGCSTRDRTLTTKHGPSAVFWHAMQCARARGCTVFDMGAVTPTDDPTDPHHSVYVYKKRWGARLETVQTGEIVVSPTKYRFQEHVLAPMWDRLHPVYLRVFGPNGPREGKTEATSVVYPTPPYPADLRPQ